MDSPAARSFGFEVALTWKGRIGAPTYFTISTPHLLFLHAPQGYTHTAVGHGLAGRFGRACYSHKFSRLISSSHLEHGGRLGDERRGQVVQLRGVVLRHKGQRVPPGAGGDGMSAGQRKDERAQIHHVLPLQLGHLAVPGIAPPTAMTTE